MQTLFEKMDMECLREAEKNIAGLVLADYAPMRAFEEQGLVVLVAPVAFPHAAISTTLWKITRAGRDMVVAAITAQEQAHSKEEGKL